MVYFLNFCITINYALPLSITVNDFTGKWKHSLTSKTGKLHIFIAGIENA